MHIKVHKKVFLPILILALAVLIFLFLKSMKSAPQQKPIEHQPPLVAVSEIEWGNWPIHITAQGIVKAKRSIQLAAQVSGQVSNLSNDFYSGGLFKKDQLLVQIEQADYQTEVKSAQAQLARAQAALKEEQARGKVAEVEWQDIKQQASDLALRIPQLETEQANVQFAQAQLERAQRQLQRTGIQAPLNAVVAARYVELGSYLNAGTVVADLYATNVAEVRLPVTLQQFEFIQPSTNQVHFAPVRVRLNNTQGKPASWQAHLVRSEKVVIEGNQTIVLVAEVDDPYNFKQGHAKALFFGQYLEAQIPLSGLGQTARIPRYLLTARQTLLVENNQRLFIREPNIAFKDSQYIYVTDGLSVGDRIITSALSNAIDGSAVRVHQSGSAKEDK